MDSILNKFLMPQKQSTALGHEELKYVITHGSGGHMIRSDTKFCLHFCKAPVSILHSKFALRVSAPPLLQLLMKRNDVAEGGALVERGI